MSRRTTGGFSLLEVIAAVMLLAIAFTAMMKVAGSSIDLTQHAAERSRAALWARSLLDSAFVFESPRPGATTGRFDDTYSWQLQVMPWNADGVPAPPPGANLPLRMFELDLAVNWHSGGHQRSAHFHTLRVAGPDNQGSTSP